MRARSNGATTRLRPSVVVVDDLLSAPALAALQRFCLEATIWFDCKEHGGYLGTYLHEGFDHPVLIALAREMSERARRHHRRAPARPDVGVQLRTGRRRHAQACGQGRHQHQPLDHAGQRPAPTPRRPASWCTKSPRPPDWDFSDYNLDPAPLERLVAQRRAGAGDGFPIVANRAVIFDSSLIHESGGVCFRSGHANRRINVTLLFRRACGGRLRQ